MINFSANWEICQISWATSLILSLRKISTTFDEHIIVHLNDEFIKSNVTDVFSTLVQQAVTDTTSELKVVKVESTAMDMAICKDRLDAADKHFDELATQLI